MAKAREGIASEPLSAGWAQLASGEWAAGDWLRRAERLLDPLEPAPEHGWLAFTRASDGRRRTLRQPADKRAERPIDGRRTPGDAQPQARRPRVA